MKGCGRKVLKWVVGLVVVASLALTGCEGGGSDDGTQTGPPFNVLELGPNVFEQAPGYYVAGVYADELEFFASPEQAGRQRQENWCWAACIQMFLNYNGVYVSQEEIVQLVFGVAVDEPANASEIEYALDGWIYENILGELVYSEAQILQSIIPLTFVDLLARRWPIIVGLDNPGLGIGHAYLLTAVYFTVTADGQIIFDRFVVRDPWPGSESRQEFAAQTFYDRFMFAAQVELHPY